MHIYSQSQFVSCALYRFSPLSIYSCALLIFSRLGCQIFFPFKFQFPYLFYHLDWIVDDSKSTPISHTITHKHLFRLYLNLILETVFPVSHGDAGRPIVSRVSFYNSTWTQSICIPGPCSFALSGGRSQTVCSVSLIAYAPTNVQLCRTSTNYTLKMLRDRMKLSCLFCCVLRRTDRDSVWSWQRLAVRGVRSVCKNVIGLSEAHKEKNMEKGSDSVSV